MLAELNMSALPSLYDQFVKLIEYLVIVLNILLFCFLLCRMKYLSGLWTISIDEK